MSVEDTIKIEINSEWWTRYRKRYILSGEDTITIEKYCQWRTQ